MLEQLKQQVYEANLQLSQYKLEQWARFFFVQQADKKQKKWYRK